MRMLAMILVMIGCVVMLGGQMVWGEDKNVCNDSKISDELKQLAGCKLNDETIALAASNWINAVIAVAGVVAVVVVIYGGFTYITSAGDAGKALKARNIILYGLIGLAVAVLSYTIVHFISASVGIS